MANSLFEMLIPKRPVSHQAKNRNLQKWKDFVYGRARQEWKGGTPLQTVGLRFTLVYTADIASVWYIENGHNAIK
jgi:crossover junction endodeoxyribonuclease RusA